MIGLTGITSWLLAGGDTLASVGLTSRISAISQLAFSGCLALQRTDLSSLIRNAEIESHVLGDSSLVEVHLPANLGIYAFELFGRLRIRESTSMRFGEGPAFAKRLIAPNCF
jgi:hypothetical protein